MVLFERSFGCREYDEILYQPRSFIPSKRFSLDRVLYRVLETSNRNALEEPSGMIGILAEYSALELAFSTLSNLKNSSNTHIKPYQKGKSEKVIGIDNNSSRVIKFNHEGKLVLLEGNNTTRPDGIDFYGFRIISEIDGLIKIVSGSRGKRETKWVVIESKSGHNFSLDPVHVHDNILEPYSQILGGRVHYLFVGMEEEVLRPERVVDPYYVEFIQTLRDLGYLSSVMSFPFDKLSIETIASRGLDTLNERRSISGGYLNNDGTIEVGFKHGQDRMRGKFIPEDHPLYHRI